ncbi:MAG: peroxidase-related enzyme [Acidiferrobacterales bacterium]|nr:peroxidase-related enzyme [Acidiferrobacterales bacterium]
MSNQERPCWIETIDPQDADPHLHKVYQKLKTTHNKLHNLYRAASLQPKAILSADQHFRDVLHNESNHSDLWFLELLATQVAIAADCHYALTHHGANFKTLLGDDELAESMIEAIRCQNFHDPSFNSRQAALLAFGSKLTRDPQSMSEDDIVTLRNAGISDTEILEAVQVIASFAYWVRFINALGISLGDEKIGMYR